MNNEITNQNIIDNEDSMNIVIVGHVDHGKSTVIGRLLADTQALPEGKLEQLREMCRRNAKPFEYAFLLDALKDERSQGITIDSARCFFKTDLRKYIIIDAPGHIEFLKNMITGASRAEAALLVIDAREGICENSRRHGYILEMLGIKQLAVLVNKMDLVGYDKDTYDKIVHDYSEFLSQINITPTSFIPVSAMEGDNIAIHSEKNIPWYDGMTVLEQLDAFKNIENEENLPLRMPVQDVYKFTADGDNRRIVAGLIETGSLSVGDEVVFYPSRKTTKVNSIEEFAREPQNTVYAGKSTGFTCTTQIYTKRGEIACKVGEPAPCVGRKFRTSIFWLGNEPMTPERRYSLKIGTAKAACKIDSIISTLDASTLVKSKKNKIERFDIADCIIETDHDIAFDLSSDIPVTSRFVIVSDYEITGGGIIMESISGGGSESYSAEVSSAERARIYGQNPVTVALTGTPENIEKYSVKIERALLDIGKLVYCESVKNAHDIEKIKLLAKAGIIAVAKLETEIDFKFDCNIKVDDNFSLDNALTEILSRAEIDI